jgi:single-strand DNA-binding protein
MSKDLNKCMFIGRLGQDPDIKYLQSGSAVCNISIAVGDDYKDKQGQKAERTEWVKCTAFGKLAEIMGEYLHKGSKVYVEGKFTTRKWQDQQGQDRYSTEINVSDMQMLDGRSDRHGAPAHRQSQPQAQQQSQPPQNQQAATPNFDDFDDDIPFAKFMKNNEYLI